MNETPEGVTLKVPDVSRATVTAPAVPAPVVPSDQRPRRADRQESQDSTSDRLLPPSIPRRFRKLSNDEVPNKIDIDAENIETPPVTRRALGTRSFRAPPNQTWLAAPRRSEDEAPEDFSARRQQRRFHSLRLDPAAAEERRRGLLKPTTTGNADSSENEDDERARLSQRYARLVELAKDVESESEVARPKPEDAARGEEEHPEKFDRHSSIRKSTRRKREDAEPTSPSSPPPAEEPSERRRPQSPSVERQTLKPAQDEHRGSNSDIERAITSISETANKLKKVDVPPPEKRDARDRRSRARSLIDGGQVAEAKRRGEKGPSIHDRLFGRGKKDKEPAAPVKRMSSLRRRREDTDEGFAEETSGASANNEESSGRRRTRPSTLSLAGLKKPATTVTRSPSVRERGTSSAGASGSSTLGRTRSREPPSSAEPTRGGLGRSQSVRVSGPARPRPVLNSATNALKALTKNLRGRGREAEPAPKPAASLHNSSGSLCSTPSVSKRSSESSLKASPKPGRRATGRVVPPSPAPVRKAAPQSTATARRAVAANGTASGARRSPAARVSSPASPPPRGSSATLPRAGRPAVVRVSSHEDAPAATTKPRRVATPSFMRPTSSSTARVDPAEKKKSVSRSITLSKPRTTQR